MKGHRQENIKDFSGRSHPLFRVDREGILWDRIITDLIGNAYMHHEMYADLHYKVRELQALAAKYKSKISIENDLLEEYLDALLRS